MTLPEQFSLAGKTILVTGASSGIGRQIAVSCALAGATLVVSGRNTDRLAALLAQLGSRAHRMVAADLLDESSVKHMAVQIGEIDGVVHSAGIAALAPLRLASKAHIEGQLATNFVAPMLLTQQLLLRNAVANGGSIVFISSISAHIGVHGVSAYSASKAALEAMARSLAIEVARKLIRVNCLAPGLVETPMLAAARSTAGGLEETLARYPLGVGQPEDVANAAVFFLSHASRWITGTTLTLDGGHTVG
ncbi:MAG: SDR family oxidoreductase [Alcaligenaceae bacterium]|nr:MAG: SDR family oxidoreductase [Alcaligenaceae bacterium]